MIVVFVFFFDYFLFTFTCLSGYINCCASRRWQQSGFIRTCAWCLATVSAKRRIRANSIGRCKRTNTRKKHILSYVSCRCVPYLHLRPCCGSRTDCRPPDQRCAQRRKPTQRCPAHRWTSACTPNCRWSSWLRPCCDWFGGSEGCLRKRRTQIEIDAREKRWDEDTVRCQLMQNKPDDTFALWLFLCETVR